MDGHNGCCGIVHVVLIDKKELTCQDIHAIIDKLKMEKTIVAHKAEMIHMAIERHNSRFPDCEYFEVEAIPASPAVLIEQPGQPPEWSDESDNEGHQSEVPDYQDIIHSDFRPNVKPPRIDIECIMKARKPSKTMEQQLMAELEEIHQIKKKKI